MPAADARALAPGEARGPALVLSEPLSFWGGIDPATGRIVDGRHPQRDRTVTGTVLVMPGARGSSSSSTVFAECVRAGTAPAAVLMAEPDTILAVGAEVAAEMYETRVPIVLVNPTSFHAIREGDPISVQARADGTATVEWS
jgi:predicted aconitase with swiveling domain